MEQELLKRFVREVKRDPSLYSYYLRTAIPSILNEYLMFLKKQSKNNASFAKGIIRYHLIRKSDHLLETVINEEYSVSSNLEHPNQKTFISQYGVLKINKELDPELYLSSDTCYISNGIYEDTESIVHQLLRQGSFIVGVCDSEDSLFFQENMKQLKELEKIIHKSDHKIQLKKIKHRQHRDTFYALYHREREEL
ncbi:MAG TPA: hypothetical protein IAB56_00030 [Candidatus Scybalousia intestinigallinarum]|nr:hypothetical protein [Candidatus Scybalousia intestinigallinarum]